ncbi:hypothetical protein PSTT_11453 [Puccinia striiformis]|uniref:Reverse transcriptase Ty1/copia-type domain-containing protein n=1 Tax=Puccinia striiformis TaxID=27350 RepID=A0A2S4V0A0_9BASI|nr:hypothetical protein PSTT_11453 [Puccinia striiformis]
MGYSQVHGLDYDEVFSPNLRLKTLRLIFSLLANKGWKGRQVDLKTAFLNGHLDTPVFMEQPPGFEDPQHPDWWNLELHKALLDLGLKNSRYDPTLYFKLESGSLVGALTTHVDDLAIVGQPNFVDSLISSLGSKFKIGADEDLHHFLLIKITHDIENHSVFLNQSHYIDELCDRFLDGNATSSPTPTNRNFKDLSPRSPSDPVLSGPYPQLIAPRHRNNQHQKDRLSRFFGLCNTKTPQKQRSRSLVCLAECLPKNGLVTHPGLKPHQRRQAEALLKDIKANLENSDDEGKTSRPDDQQMGPAQTPPRPTPAISAAPRQTQAAAIRTKAHQFPPKNLLIQKNQELRGISVCPTQLDSLIRNPPASLTEGDQFLASITASQNTHMSPPTAPALNTRLRQAPCPEPNSRSAQAPHTNLGPSLSPRPRQPDIHEPTQRPTKYRFDNVRLEGMENDVAAKKARVGSPGSDDVRIACRYQTRRTSRRPFRVNSCQARRIRRKTTSGHPLSNQTTFPHQSAYRLTLNLFDFDLHRSDNNPPQPNSSDPTLDLSYFDIFTFSNLSSQETLTPGKMNQGWSRRSFSQNENGYETRIRYLEEIIHLLLTKTSSHRLPMVSSAPPAGLLRYSVDRGLVPLLSEATARSLAVAQCNYHTYTGPPARTHGLKALSDNIVKPRYTPTIGSRRSRSLPVSDLRLSSPRQPTLIRRSPAPHQLLRNTRSSCNRGSPIISNSSSAEPWSRIQGEDPHSRSRSLDRLPCSSRPALFKIEHDLAKSQIKKHNHTVSPHSAKPVSPAPLSLRSATPPEPLTTLESPPHPSPTAPPRTSLQPGTDHHPPSHSLTRTDQTLVSADPSIKAGVVESRDRSSNLPKEEPSANTMTDASTIVDPHKLQSTLPVANTSAASAAIINPSFISRSSPRNLAAPNIPATDSTATAPLPSTTPISIPLITPEKIQSPTQLPTIISLPSCPSSPAPTPVQENLTQSSTVTIHSTLAPVSDNPFPTFTAPSNHSFPTCPLELQPAPEFLEYYDDEGNCFKLPNIFETEKKKKKKKKTTTSGSNPSLPSSPSEVQTASVGGLSTMVGEVLAALERKNDPRYRPIEDAEFIGLDECNDNPTSTPDNPILFYV